MVIYNEDADYISLKFDKLSAYCSKVEDYTKKWGEFFVSYREMAMDTPSVFPDVMFVINILLELTPRATVFASKDNNFNSRYWEYKDTMFTYIKDQQDIYKELMEFKNVDNNIFTFMANQTMRIPELKAMVEKLFDECLILEEEMNSIEKVVASMRIPAN